MAVGAVPSRYLRKGVGGGVGAIVSAPLECVQSVVCR